MKKYTYRMLMILSFIIFTRIFLSISLLFIRLSNISVDLTDNNEQDKKEAPIVIIDAGHGGEDGGAIGINGCLEKDINLSMAKKLQAMLSGIGIKCILTRTEDILLYDRNVDYEGRKKKLDMDARLNIANSYDNVIFISVHQNSFPQERYNGTQIYYSPNDPQSANIAHTLQNSIKSNLQPDNNRISKASDGKIYLLDKLNCPAVLIECGFISNRSECVLLCDEAYQSKFCSVIASTVADILKNTP